MGGETHGSDGSVEVDDDVDVGGEGGDAQRHVVAVDGEAHRGVGGAAHGHHVAGREPLQRRRHVPRRRPAALPQPRAPHVPRPLAVHLQQQQQQEHQTMAINNEEHLIRLTSLMEAAVSAAARGSTLVSPTASDPAQCWSTSSMRTWNTYDSVQHFCVALKTR